VPKTLTQTGHTGKVSPYTGNKIGIFILEFVGKKSMTK